MNILELLAVAATVINLWYCYHERVENFFWNWPAYGLIAVGMFLNHAYANATMLIIQAGISTYGFFIWTKHRNHSLKEMLISMIYDRHHIQYRNQSVIAISKMSLRSHLYSIIGIAVISACTYRALGFFNDIEPIIDAVSFAIFPVAAIQLNYKKIDSWIYYVIADLFSMILAYHARNLYNVISLFLFLQLNLICFSRWLKNMKKQKIANL